MPRSSRRVSSPSSSSRRPLTIKEWVAQVSARAQTSDQQHASITLNLKDPGIVHDIFCRMLIWTIPKSLEVNLKLDVDGAVKGILFNGQVNLLKALGYDRNPGILYYNAQMVKSHNRKLRPLLMILHCNSKVLKKALRLLKQDKEIRKLFTKLEMLLALRQSDTPPLSSSSQLNKVSVLSRGNSLGRKFCGAGVHNQSTNCYATLGGVVQVNNGDIFGLTAQHVFSEPVPPKSSEERRITLYDSDFSLIGHAEETGIVDSTPERILPDTQKHSPLREQQDKDGIPSSQIMVKTRISSQSMDWALVEEVDSGPSSSSATEPVRLEKQINEIQHGKGKSLFPTQVAETPPNDLVLVATRRGTLSASGAGLNFDLPDRERRKKHRHIRELLSRLYQRMRTRKRNVEIHTEKAKHSGGDAQRDENELWTIQLHAGKFVPGDSGSWVVGLDNGNLYGMLVRADPELGQGYLIPAKNMFSEIAIRFQIQEEKRALRNHSRMTYSENGARVDLPGIQHSLFYAVEQGDIDLLRRLLEPPARITSLVNEPHQHRKFALVEAVRRGNLDTIEILLYIGANIDNPANSCEENSLYVASSTGNEDVLKLLLSQGARVNIETGSMKSALCIAAKNGHRSVVRTLLERGADPTKPGDALHAASESGKEGAVEALLDHGVELSVVLDSLHAASKAGYEGVVRLLVSRGVDVNTRPRVLDSVIHEPFSAEHYSIVEYFLENGAKLDIKDSSKANAALCFAIEKNYSALIDLILNGGGSLENIRHDVVNEVRKDGQTALTIAVSNIKRQVVRRLLEVGADPNKQIQNPETRPLKKDRDRFSATGDTPISLAVTTNDAEALDLLLKYEAEVNDGLDHTSLALFLASKLGNLDFVRILVSKGANLDSTGPQGQYHGTSLSAAASKGHTDVVKLLIQKGAKLQGPTGPIHPFCRPLHAAVHAKQEETARTLLDNGADAAAAIICLPPWTRGPGNKAMRELLQSYVDEPLKDLLGDEKHEGDYDKFMGRFEHEWEEVREHGDLSP